MVRFCKKYVFQYKYSYMVYLFLSFLLAGISILLPIIMGQFIDMFENPVTYKKLMGFVVTLLVFYIGKEVLTYLNKMLYVKIQTNAAFSLNSDIIEHLKKVSPLLMGKTDLSYLSQRINNDANDVLIFFISSVTEVFIASISTIFILIIIMRMNIVAFCITLVLLGMYFAVYIIFKRKIYTNSYDMKEEQSNFFARLQEQLEKSEFIKIHGTNTFFVNRLVMAFEKLYAAVFKQQATVQIFANTQEILGAVSVCILLTFGGLEIIRGHMQIGFFYVITTYFNMILEYGKCIIGYGQGYQEAYVSYERIKSIFEIKKQLNGEIQLSDVTCIEFKKVNFAYEEKLILKDINIKLNKGFLYGISGENGRGKSTLIKILLGLYIEEYQGNIYWNNIEMKNLDMDYCREELIGFTEQEPILISDSIYHNLTLYKTINDDMVKNISSYFNTEFLTPQNWNLRINEKSSNISGGEKQKIAIIRQFIKNCPVMIFDEPTSALDLKSKKRFWELLETKKSNKIILVVSHDTDVLERCDELIEL